MRASFLPLLLLFGFVQLASGIDVPPPGNLVVNGGFDSGFVGWTGTYGILTPQNYPINPPPLSGGNVGIVDAGQNAMSQSFSTVPGKIYEIDFGMRVPDLDSNGIPIEGDSRALASVVNVLWDNQSLEQLVVQNRTTWNIYTVDVVALTTTSELAFSAAPGTASPFIDNVSVVSVIPEPSPLAMVGLGTILMSLSLLARQRVSAKDRVCH